jgi:hypothetical protein
LKNDSWDGRHGIRGVDLPLSLRGDEGNIGGHPKKRERYLGTAEEEKVAHLS